MTAAGIVDPQCGKFCDTSGYNGLARVRSARTHHLHPLVLFIVSVFPCDRLKLTSPDPQADDSALLYGNSANSRTRRSRTAFHDLEDFIV